MPVSKLNGTRGWLPGIACGRLETNANLSSKSDQGDVGVLQASRFRAKILTPYGLSKVSDSVDETESS